MKIATIKNESDLKSFAENKIKSWIFSNQKKNSISMILLSGDLGTGKTTLTKFIVDRLILSKKLSNIPKVKSPTFTIQNEYNINHLNQTDIDYKIFHLDLYRLQDKFEFKELKIFEQLKQKDVLIIEWANKFSEYLVENNIPKLFLEISYEHNEKERKIKYKYTRN